MVAAGLITLPSLLHAQPDKEENKKKIFLYMFVSIVFWSVLLTTIFEMFHVVNLPQLKDRMVG